MRTRDSDGKASWTRDIRRSAGNKMGNRQRGRRIPFIDRRHRPGADLRGCQKKKTGKALAFPVLTEASRAKSALETGLVGHDRQPAAERLDVGNRQVGVGPSLARNVNDSVESHRSND